MTSEQKRRGLTGLSEQDREALAAERNRFMQKVEKTDTCWLWTGSLSPDGYGNYHFIAAGRHQRAHRISYEMFVGPIPEGLVIDHLCRVRHCVNPEHLEAVTDRVNILRSDGITARRARATHCERGHEFTEDNTFVSKAGHRKCRTCIRAGARRRHHEQKCAASDCLHPGRHVRRLKCPNCGQFSTHAWSTDWYETPDGGNQQWGGICKTHGEWSEHAA